VFGLLEDLAEGLLGGTVWGIGLAAAAVAVVAGPRAKPAAKSAIKGYFAATQRVREWAAEASEQAQDLYAEAKYEYESELSSRPAAARPRRRNNKAAAAETPA
jgi:hypothetical protein